MQPILLSEISQQCRAYFNNHGEKIGNHLSGKQ